MVEFIKSAAGIIQQVMDSIEIKKYNSKGDKHAKSSFRFQ